MKRDLPEAIMRENIVSAIIKDDVEALKICLDRGEKLTSDDLHDAFYGGKYASPKRNTSLNVLWMLEKYNAFPEGANIATWYYVLKLLGHTRIFTYSSKPIDYKGIKGLPSPMQIYIEHADVDNVNYLIFVQKITERPINLCLVNSCDHDYWWQINGRWKEYEVKRLQEKVNDKIYNNKVNKRCQIAKLFISNPTEHLKMTIHNMLHPYPAQYYFTLLFGWLAKNNDCSLFDNQVFIECAKDFA